jgi:hypothetical protein
MISLTNDIYDKFFHKFEALFDEKSKSVGLKLFKTFSEN